MESQFILGISAFYHDSAACLLRDGEIIAAAQEERFTRKKGDASFPKHAVEYCLKSADIGVSDLAYVGFYDKPLLKFERILESFLARLLAVRESWPGLDEGEALSGQDPSRGAR